MRVHSWDDDVIEYLLLRVAKALRNLLKALRPERRLRVDVNNFVTFFETLPGNYRVLSRDGHGVADLTFPAPELAKKLDNLLRFHPESAEHLVKFFWPGWDPEQILALLQHLLSGQELLGAENCLTRLQDLVHLRLGDAFDVAQLLVRLHRDRLHRVDTRLLQLI